MLFCACDFVLCIVEIASCVNSGRVFLCVEHTVAECRLPWKWNLLDLHNKGSEPGRVV